MLPPLPRPQSNDNAMVLVVAVALPCQPMAMILPRYVIEKTEPITDTNKMKRNTH
jgi:hypothetical protein